MPYVCTRKPSNMSRRPDLASRLLATSKRRIKAKIRFICEGGALDGHKLYLSTPGTMPFTINGITGYYNSLMKWVEL